MAKTAVADIIIPTELIEDNYFRPVSEPDLIDSSLRGMFSFMRVPPLSFRATRGHTKT